MTTTTPHEALIYLMVVTSASDREMADLELSGIGDIVRSWPVFEDFDAGRLIAVAQVCQRLVGRANGLDAVLDIVRVSVPERLHDTAYALAVEVAAADREMRLEEVRVIQLLRHRLVLDPAIALAIERGAKARYRTLT